RSRRKCWRGCHRSASQTGHDGPESMGAMDRNTHPKGKRPEAMEAMRGLMAKLGLTVNEKKTRLAKLPDETFGFPGYTVGRFYGRDGRPYWGTRPSRKSVKRLIMEIHEATTSRWNALDIQSRIAHLNPRLRGWATCSNQMSAGPIAWNSTTVMRRCTFCLG
ncbi:MAG: group intron reverse transcriptase/maturase, partial [Herminiimonas sp.]|nr:group intron reverse transcriptase/maturase [Herminiimonas sp.]